MTKRLTTGLALLTRADAVGLGVSERTWRRRIASERWCEVRPGVAGLPGWPDSLPRRVQAAVLSVGEGTLASHGTSLSVWGVEGLDLAELDVVVDRGRHPQLPGVRIHRPRDRDDLRPSRWAGVDLVNPLRALLDLGQTLPEAVGDALAQMIIAGRVAPSAVMAVLGRHAAHGRHGVAALRDAVEGWPFGERPPDSVLEVRFAELITASGLPTPLFHQTIDAMVVDVVFPEARVIVELDGWDVHGSRHAFEVDRARDARLAALGWVVVRFTWFQVVRQGDRVAAQLRSILAQRQAA